ncbi:type II secretion system protein GspD [Neotamlana laminarinivorans]|uniref:General secretion pathway protein GspD n=1 Tax=Neotamlana laminarinivorans TaxID=2883124 RepID=A0A9X1HZH4_9FLAO|nr:general secretion pathway protein GspD [Tamlana laminarinivorans]MCB4797214.1 general secretion pathway protein GspD [Tamlana laminarinivorans]
MKQLLQFLFFLIIGSCFSQHNQARLHTIKNQLDALAVDNSGLNESVKSEINVANVSLSNFLLGISNVHKVNLNLTPELNQISIVNNFSNVTVADLLLFLCKEYNLTIDFTGNILSIKKYVPEALPPQKHIIPVTYTPSTSTLSIDAKNDKLYDVFKRITDESGKNLVFTPGLENKTITSYIKDMPFDVAMENLALANTLIVTKTKDNFYVFESTEAANNNLSNHFNKNENEYKILNSYTKLLEVNFNNTPISRIINNLSKALNLNVFTATPLKHAGNITFKTKSITFDDLLVKIFETQAHQNNTPTKSTRGNNKNNPTTSNADVSNAAFTFKKENDTYFFGTENQLSVRSVDIIHLQHRSVELLSNPDGASSTNRTAGRTNSQSTYNNYTNGYSSANSNSFNTNNNSNLYTNSNNLSNNSRRTLNVNTNTFNNASSKAEALLSVLPDEITADLDIKVDFELNSFYVNGPSGKIERLKAFINKIDKPVPVILIEVMIIEVNKTATLETGVSWNIGESATETQGSLFPNANLTLGSTTINKILNGFDGFGLVNIGSVVPNFSATIKAMESNGNIKVRSTPKLSTLNGHRATFSNGQTSYYAVTQTNIYGIDNPQTSEITNYQPIDAELGLTIKPMVSGDGQVTLEIFVVQSSFGTRVAEDAPPDLNSREFTSIIRVKDQDIVVLGGLEEREKNDAGSGVPFLARIPIIKWLFSERSRTDSKAKLTVLIKPTVIY